MYGQMWELDHKEGWASKNGCFQIVILEKTLESPLDCKIKSVIPKGNQPWIYIGKTGAKDETAILWPLDAKSRLIRKDPDTGKYWRQEAKRMTGDVMVWWHHRLNGNEFKLAPGVHKGLGSLAYCSPCEANSRTQLAEQQQQATCWSFEMWLKRLRNWILKFTQVLF